MDAPVIALILVVVWRAPVWGQRVLAFLRDLDNYRAGDQKSRSDVAGFTNSDRAEPGA